MTVELIRMNACARVQQQFHLSYFLTLSLSLKYLDLLILMFIFADSPTIKVEPLDIYPSVEENMEYTTPTFQSFFGASLSEFSHTYDETQFTHHMFDYTGTANENVDNRKKSKKKRTRLTCTICSKSFYNEKNLARHQLSTHEMGKRSLKCEICLKFFFDQNSLAIHILAAHDASQHFKETSITCEICSESFAHQKNWAKHMRLAHETGKTCEMCSKSFVHRRDLERHKLYAHEMERPFVCPECGRTFPREYMLKVHFRFHKNAVTGLFTVNPNLVPTLPSYKCDLCDAFYSSDSLLERHVKSSHKNGEFFFSCDLYGRVR